MAPSRNYRPAYAQGKAAFVANPTSFVNPHIEAWAKRGFEDGWDAASAECDAAIIATWADALFPARAA